MSETVVVYRQPADKPCPDEVSNSLLTDTRAKHAAAVALLDENSTNRKIISGSGPYIGRVAPGTLVSYTSSTRGEVRGVVDKCARVIEINRNDDGTISFDATTNLEIEVEA